MGYTKQTLHVARQYFICLCFVAAVWCKMWTFPILMYGKIPLPIAVVPENVNNKSYIIAISMTHRISWQPVEVFITVQNTSTDKG